MKITHIALTGIFTDNWTYQENLLTKYHKKIGHDVSVITSKYIYDNNGSIIQDNRDYYINEDGVKIIRLQIKNNKPFNYRFKKYLHLYSALEAEAPDILFIHGCQFVDINVIVKYVKSNKNIKIFVDNHADLTNSASNWLSKNILHKIIWKHFAHKIEPYTTKFYGVLPARVDFLKNIYKLPEEKLELLVMGADDEKVVLAKNPNIRKIIRDKYGIKEDDFLIISGGKIDNAKKQIILLMEAVKIINNDNVKLIVFGSVINDLRNKVISLADGKKIHYIGWLDADDSYNYFAAADLVVFPGRHSVYWEQVVGLRIPMIARYWDGTDHIDIGGNCKYFYEDSVEEIKAILEVLVNNKKEYSEMYKAANNFKSEEFLYSIIAKKSINY